MRTTAGNAGHRARKRARRFGVRGTRRRFALFGGVSLARAGKVWYSKTNDDRARMKPARAALQARRRKGGQPPRRKEGIRMAHKHREETEIVWSDRKHILWFPWTFEVYRIGDGRIYTRKGLVNIEENECMLYRVLDISLKRTLLNLICGTGSIILRTKDASDSILTLKNVADSQNVKDMISELVEEERQAKGLVGREMFGAGGGRMDGAYRDAIDEE